MIRTPLYIQITPRLIPVHTLPAIVLIFSWCNPRDENCQGFWFCMCVELGLVNQQIVHIQCLEQLERRPLHGSQHWLLEMEYIFLKQIKQIIQLFYPRDWLKNHLPSTFSFGSARKEDSAFNIIFLTCIFLLLSFIRFLAWFTPKRIRPPMQGRPKMLFPSTGKEEGKGISLSRTISPWNVR